MKLKRIKLLLPISVLSLTSIGFSTWNITISSVLSTDVYVGKVNKLSDFITFDETINFFEFCPYGIIQDETIVDTGNLSVGFYFTNLQEFISNEQNSSIHLAISLKSSCKIDSSFNIFNYLSNTTNPKYSITENKDNLEYINDLTDYTVNSSTASFDFNFTIENISLYTSNQFYFSLNLQFDFSSVMNNFEQAIYQKVGNDNLSFKLYINLL